MTNETKQKLTSFDKMVDDIIDGFNFEKIRKALFSLNWNWAHTDRGIELIIQDFKETAECLLRDVAKNRLDEYNDTNWEKPILCRSGGFKAKAWCNETKTRITHLQLQFVIVDGDSKEKLTYGGNK
jgi:hypothetical protein